MNKGATKRILLTGVLLLPAASFLPQALSRGPESSWRLMLMVAAIVAFMVWRERRISRDPDYASRQERYFEEGWGDLRWATLQWFLLVVLATVIFAVVIMPQFPDLWRNSTGAEGFIPLAVFLLGCPVFILLRSILKRAARGSSSSRRQTADRRPSSR
jgi:hypothetical protein